MTPEPHMANQRKAGTHKPTPDLKPATPWVQSRRATVEEASPSSTLRPPH